MMDMGDRKQINTRIKISQLIAALAGITILFPLIYYRENYIFTIHDYLDSWPPLFQVLRKSDLFFAPDSKMPIMDGISTCYLYFDFGVYRLLNFCFGAIWGEIINKSLGVILGFCFAKHLFDNAASVFQHAHQSDVEKRENICNTNWFNTLLATAYAVTAVYPNWTLSFAFLPVYLEMLYNLIIRDANISIKRIILSLLLGFLVYFPCIGIFIFGLYFLAFLVDMIRYKRIKKDFLLYEVLMLGSIIAANINIFIYVMRGDVTNRTLFDTGLPENLYSGVRSFLKITGKVGLVGQYHAAPVLYILLPLCIVGYISLFFQLYKKKKIKEIIVPTIIVIIIIVLCCMYALNELRVLGVVISKIFPFLQGFNMGRIVYFNNILWYLLAISIFVKMDRKSICNKAIFLLLVINVGVVILSPGNYRDTVKNIFHEKSLAEGNVTFAQFYDTNYFDELKKEIAYQNEAVISVGYHPAVAMYNGFNTLDGYISTNPIEYHDKFREIIAPSLSRYQELEIYYDTWGGRLYCYVDASKNVEPDIVSAAEKKTLYIDTEAFKKLGGKYILSKWELENENQLGLALAAHKTDDNNSIYKVWVYEVEGSNE